MRPAKAHRRAPAPRSLESVAAEAAREAREEFERQIVGMRVYVAHDVAVDAACVVATSKGEFDLLVDAVEALLLADA